MNGFWKEMGLFSMAAVGAVFTFSFIRAVQENLLNPLMQAYVFNQVAGELQGLTVPLRGGYVLDGGRLLTELFAYLTVVGILFAIWITVGRRRHQNSI